MNPESVLRPRLVLLFVAALFCGSGLAGCLDGPTPLEHPVAVGAGVAETPPEPEAATTVVAVIDSGVNPFHTTFSRPETREPGSVPIPAVDATTGEAAQYALVPSVETIDDPAAETFTAAIETRTLYRFAGTPFYYYSFQPIDGALDTNGHGTHAAAALLQGGPETFVVVIRAGLGDEDTAEALEWAAAQPWIDIVSMSRGYVLNGVLQQVVALRDPGTAESARQVADASRAVWDAGKLLFVSAGNDPTLAATDPYGGPLWCIVVGGYDPYWNGETVMASKGADIVGHFSVEVARHDAVDGTVGIGGTSFAAPMAAGVTGQALLATRDALGHIGGMRDGSLVVPGPGADADPLDNSAVRAAINASAHYPNLDERYDPTQSRPDTQTGEGPESVALEAVETAFQASIPINPVAPWIQMGWGLVGPSQRDVLASALVDGPADDKPAAAKAHMAQLARLRIQQWQGTEALLDDILPR